MMRKRFEYTIQHLNIFCNRSARGRTNAPRDKALTSIASPIAVCATKSTVFMTLTQYLRSWNSFVAPPGPL